MRYLSPLRYPGAKSGLANVVGDLVRESSKSLGRPQLFVEPFAGGSSTALRLAGARIVDRILLADADPLVTRFWQVAAADTEWLIDRMPFLLLCPGRTARSCQADGHRRRRRHSLVDQGQHDRPQPHGKRGDGRLARRAIQQDQRQRDANQHHGDRPGRPGPTVAVVENTVGRNLNCTGLAPGVSGGFIPGEVNHVGGNATGQCASLV